MGHMSTSETEMRRAGRNFGGLKPLAVYLSLPLSRSGLLCVLSETLQQRQYLSIPLAFTVQVNGAGRHNTTAPHPPGALLKAANSPATQPSKYEHIRETKNHALVRSRNVDDTDSKTPLDFVPLRRPPLPLPGLSRNQPAERLPRHPEPRLLRAVVPETPVRQPAAGSVLGAQARQGVGGRAAARLHARRARVLRDDEAAGVPVQGPAA